MHRGNTVFYWVPLVTLLALVLSGCANEPMMDTTAAQLAATEQAAVTPPLVAPSLADGATHFQQYCASCHTQATAAEISAGAPEHLISAGWVEQTSPAEMFTLLSEGKPDEGMPAFASLSTGDRWDLVAYLLSMVSTPANQSGGALVYQNLCQSCHGSDGSGDGVQAVSQQLDLQNWPSQPLLVSYSNADLYTAIQGGHNMGDFAAMLTKAQLWSLVTTVRSLSLSAPAANVLPQTATGQSASDADLSQNEGFFIIEGKVSNGSGGDISDLKTVRLVVANGAETLQEMTAPVTQNGTFHFYLVPYHPSWTYIAEIEHDGIAYTSPRLSGQNFASADTVPLTVQIYDAITDVSVLRGERLHALLNFQTDGTIHVTESLLVNNPSSYTVSSNDTGTPLLQFKLGSDAQAVEYDEFSEDQSLKWMNGVLGDWQPILPGSVHQVMFEYDLPFKGDQTIHFDVPVPVASAMIMVENQGREIGCGGMQFSNRTTGESPAVLIFTGTNITAGDELSLHCYDKKSLLSIAIGIGILVFAILVTVWIVLTARRKSVQKMGATQKNVNKNTLLDAIITLDDQYKAGTITAEVYRAKREELIRKLEGG